LVLFWSFCAPVLLKLPGVGPKIGLLVLSVGFAMGDCGIVVDTHVHRVPHIVTTMTSPHHHSSSHTGGL
jgi:endonuclease III